MNAFSVATALCIASPHVLYAFIWFYPNVWRRHFGIRSVEVFSSVAAAGKVVQFTAAGVWLYVSRRQQSEPLSLTRVSALAWLLCGALIVLGQILNAGIYAAIGKAGVYYGFKLGRKVPWHTGFPFNLGIAHPQYVGSVMTVWGVGGLLWTQAPANFGILLTYWTLLYVATGIQEQYY